MRDGRLLSAALTAATLVMLAAALLVDPAARIETHHVDDLCLGASMGTLFGGGLAWLWPSS